MTATWALPDTHLPKANRVMRALRRAVLAFWYATIEDIEAATIEAATAAYWVNVLDEAVFEAAFGEAYRSHRNRDRLGRVVMGLELVRNCETHASVIAEALLVSDSVISVPLGSGASAYRSVPRWALYKNLPPDYVESKPGATEKQKRARKEAQDGYRKAVESRHVIETLFDAMAFFQLLDGRLVAPDLPQMRWAFGVVELPDTDPGQGTPQRWFACQPLGLDQYEPFLPDLACHQTERRCAGWNAADKSLEQIVKQAKRGLPSASGREVLSALIDDEGQLIGYGGLSTGDGVIRNGWAERRQQVWKDIRKGYRYFVVTDDGSAVDLSVAGEGFVRADNPSDGGDILESLPSPSEWGLDLSHLRMHEDYDDLYLRARRAE